MTRREELLRKADLLDQAALLCPEDSARRRAAADELRERAVSADSRLREIGFVRVGAVISEIMADLGDQRAVPETCS